MRMSVPVYFCLIFATALVLFTFALNPDPSFLLITLPMLAVFAGIPIILNIMNRRQAESVDMESFKLYSIKIYPGLARCPGSPARQGRGDVIKMA